MPPLDSADLPSKAPRNGQCPESHRPDKDRDGLFGQGSASDFGALSTRRPRAVIHAEVIGWDTRTPIIFARPPGGDGAVRAIRAALKADCGRGH